MPNRRVRMSKLGTSTSFPSLYIILANKSNNHEVHKETLKDVELRSARSIIGIGVALHEPRSNSLPRQLFTK